MQIVFCDVDEMTQDFLNKLKRPSGMEFITFQKSLNDISDSELSPYYGAEVISTFVYSRLDRGLMSKFKNLKLVSTRSTGYNNVDLEYCKINNIKVTNVVGYGEITVAEFAIGMMLDLVRKISFSNSKLKNGIVDVKQDIGIDIHGKTIGVIGTGSIGRHFAKLANAFGATVIAYDLYPNQSLVNNGICAYTDLETIYKDSDIISLNCPATKENHRMINKSSIAKMKDGVYIINTARGELIDTADLYNALVNGKVRGAGLDVLDFEDIILKNDINMAYSKGEEFAFYSMVNQKMLQLPNVIITPHIAFNSVDAVLRILNICMSNVFDFVDEKEIKCVV